MTYQKLLHLKFKKGLPTQELAKLFPEDRQRVSEVALIDLPDQVLRELLATDPAYERVLRLKKRLKSL